MASRAFSRTRFQLFPPSRCSRGSSSDIHAPGSRSGCSDSARACAPAPAAATPAAAARRPPCSSPGASRAAARSRAATGGGAVPRRPALRRPPAPPTRGPACAPRRAGQSTACRAARAAASSLRRRGHPTPPWHRPPVRQSAGRAPALRVLRRRRCPRDRSVRPTPISAPTKRATVSGHASRRRPSIAARAAPALDQGRHEP